MTAPAPLLLVNGHHLLHWSHLGFPKRFHALDGTDVTGAFGFVALLRKAHRAHCADHEVLVVFDAEDGSACRVQVDAGYKANRAEADHSPIQALAPLHHHGTADGGLRGSRGRLGRRHQRVDGPAGRGVRTHPCPCSSCDARRSPASPPCRSPRPPRPLAPLAPDLEESHHDDPFHRAARHRSPSRERCRPVPPAFEGREQGHL
ncbi:hypothetical protein ACFWB1_21925 [Streptomyces goshikiensis]|uniref:hypothetical protein n=1 Tax=Streptomyces goshikiensis TaxID=1942 RepID=UPI0036B71041